MLRTCSCLAFVCCLFNPLPQFLHAGGITLTQVGDPIWSPQDLHTFAAPHDNLEDDAFPLFEATFDAVQGDNCLFNSRGPCGAVDPPYDTIYSDGIPAAGFQSASVFQPSDIGFGGVRRGIYFVWTILPDPGTTGSSTDFDSGPIIPNNLFPIDQAGTLFRERVVVDPEFGFPIPAPPNRLGVAGRARWPAGHSAQASFYPEFANVIGSWEYHFSWRDVNGNGWDVVFPFQIVPEPGDYNQNGAVDAADYNVWRDTFGSIHNLSADGNSNGVVDTPDYNIWRDNFDNAASASVPEPSSSTLLIAAAVLQRVARRAVRI